MPRFRFLQLILTGVLLLAPLGAVAQAQSVHRSSVTVAGRVVPLPPGDWIEAGRSSSLVAFRNTGRQYTRESMLLVQRQGGRVTGLVDVAFASTNPTQRISWVIPNTCSRDDTYANLTREALERSQDCLLLSHWTMDPVVAPQNPSEHWRDFWRTANAEPNTIPRTTVGAQFALADPANVLQVTYRFSVEAKGFPREETNWANSSWHRGRLNDRRRATVNELQAWAEQARPIMQAAFNSGRAAPLPAF